MRLEKYLDNELLIIEAWGRNSLRVRAFPNGVFQEEKGALQEEISISDAVVRENDNGSVEIVNGDIRAVLDDRKRLTFYNSHNQVLLREYIRLRAVQHDDGSEDVGTIKVTKAFNSTLKLKSREYRANYHGNDFSIKVRFESNSVEKIYGMGQYQHEFLDLKHTMLELAQRNSQMSIPFYISNLNYGFLWNNPGIGTVNFAKNLTEWSMPATTYIDYWITVGESPKELMENYSGVTGRAPVMPKNLLGLWQSKLRYRTPDEVLEVVEGYHKRGIQLSTIAIDYFHWPKQGEYCFDKDFWPDPKGLVDTLKQVYNVEPIISIWPTVQTNACNFQEYQSNGYLVQVNRGVPITMMIQGQTIFIDTTNPKACQYVWSLIEKNYKRLGIDYYWIDVAEPGYAVYDFDNYRYHKGPVLHCGNLYPLGYLKMIYDGNGGESVQNVILVRGAWAGAQRYGALPWSGDIDSSFKSFRNQVNTGLNVGLAGIPWWTTDIGGFHGGNPENSEFRELMVRWFQYATFSPILRMHGDRLPHTAPLSVSGGGSMPSGAPNEIWSYGDTVESIMTDFLRIRERLNDYLYNIMVEAHEKGYPVMRSLFFEFPDDQNAWEIDNTYLLGDSLLVAPILDYEARERTVYLPTGETWIHLFSQDEYEGGKQYLITADLYEIPVFIRKSSLPSFENLLQYVKCTNEKRRSYLCQS
ncbi:glycoside hydrolase family 31 protein [Streptococcus marmotae]|uniref:glycoside hydrolase family 31 protein n=1 Tax=Streptococcus marmotae TaxID=1825069 RepID=UPI0008321DA8|nr:TIM-barrel domain-containing protein [Streptococcus marmotae]